ncbi:MAG TPA: hypothetical protein VM051_00135 [Usitatibacter sp.]|nr:hypothetical protein [Usitatibacter sp.]
MNVHDLPFEAIPAAQAVGARAHFEALRKKLDSLVAQLPAVTPDKMLDWNWNRFEDFLPRIDMTLGEMQCMLDGVHQAGGDAHVVAAQQGLFATYRKIAAQCEEHLRALARRFGTRDVRTLRAIAYCLHFVAESFKLITNPLANWPYASLNSIWKLAVASGHEAQVMSLPIGGPRGWSSIESLYLRALALAWAARCGLSTSQREIFDEWIGTWLPSLEHSSSSGQILRSDPASDFGLSMRPTDGDRHAQLAWERLVAAARWLEAELAAGRTLPHVSPRRAPSLSDQRHTFAALRAALLRHAGRSS